MQEFVEKLIVMILQPQDMRFYLLSHVAFSEVSKQYAWLKFLIMI